MPPFRPILFSLYCVKKPPFERGDTGFLRVFVGRNRAAFTKFTHFFFVLVSSNDSFSLFRHFSVDSPEGDFGCIRLLRTTLI
jgi:hypothetical protein